MKLLGIRIVNYLTNHMINHVPSYRMRHFWYRKLGMTIGSGSGIHLGCYVWFYGPGQVRRSQVRIGVNSRINRSCCIDARGSLTIGDNVSISPEVVLLTTQHAWRQANFPLESRPVVIEDHVWIGMRAIVLPGTFIGRGAVVAAGSVVSGQVAPRSVVAGVPARQVAQRPKDALNYELTHPFPLFE